MKVKRNAKSAAAGAQGEETLPPRAHVIVYTLAALLAIAGLADATYLTVQALTGETLTCGGSPDCFRVLGSAYARVAGVPVAAFGVAAYFGAFGSATFAAFGHWRARQLFAAVVAVMFFGTLWLLVVQTFFLHAFCRYCLFSAAVTFLLTGLMVSLPGSLKQQM